MSLTAKEPIPWPLFVMLCAIMVCTLMCTVWFATLLPRFSQGTWASKDQVKIECFLHRDNPDVHKLCVDTGYDR